jgi:acyl carrier protein
MKASAVHTEPMDAGKRQILGDVAQVICAVSDHIPPSKNIEMDTVLVDDLALESVEVASLIYRLNAHYAGAVSMGDFVLEIAGTDRISGLSVGSIVDFIDNSLRMGPSDSVTAPESDVNSTSRS